MTGGDASVALNIRIPPADRSAIETWRREYEARTGRGRVTTADAVRILLRAGIRATGGDVPPVPSPVRS